MEVLSRPMTISEIMSATGLGRSLVYVLLKELQSKGLAIKRIEEGQVKYARAESEEEEYRRYIIQMMIKFVRTMTGCKDARSALPLELIATDSKTLQDRLKAKMGLGLEIATPSVSRDYVRWERTHSASEMKKALFAQMDRLQPHTQEWALQAIRNTVARPRGFAGKHLGQVRAEEDTMSALLEILDTTPTRFSDVIKKLRNIKEKEGKKKQRIYTHVGCSQTTVSKYLDMLEDMRLIDNLGRGYVLRGKGEKLKHQIANARKTMNLILARKIKGVIEGDPTAIQNLAKMWSELAKDPIDALMLCQLMVLAQKRPNHYEKRLKLYEEAMIAFTRNRCIGSLSQIPREKLNRTFNAELVAALTELGKASFWQDLFQLTHAFLHEMKCFYPEDVRKE
jgi:DNA-binding transcriptional regulator GbsR (MarR family)/predicted transcriptional regulator